MKLRVLALLLTALAFASCATYQMEFMKAKGTVKKPSVIFSPSNNGVLAVKTPGADNGCATNSNKGCVAFGKGELGIITFALDGGDKGKDCSDDAKWVITEVLLSAFGDLQTEKGVDFGKPQPQWLQDAFAIESPPDLPNGVLYKEATDEAAGMVEFINLNNNDPEQPEKIVYYQVTAEKCDRTGIPAVTDPAIRNTGGGSST